MQKRTGKRAGSKKPARTPRKKSWVLDEGVRQLIREEAANLKLSEEEYLRLVAHFSEVVRTTLLPAGVMDGGFLTMILQNPMVLDMLKGMIRNMLQGAMNKSKSVSTDRRGGLPGGGSWSEGRQGLPAPQQPYGQHRPSIQPPAAPYGPHTLRPGPQGFGGPQGFVGPQWREGPQGYGSSGHGGSGHEGSGRTHGDAGSWGMSSERESDGGREPSVEADDGEQGNEGFDLESLSRMVGQFLQK